MYSFADLSETEIVLEKLADWPGGGLLKKLPRQPGQKEARYAHLLAGEPAVESAVDSAVAPAPSRVAQLEADLQELRSEFDQLKQRFDDLEAQFR